MLKKLIFWKITTIFLLISTLIMGLIIVWPEPDGYSRVPRIISIVRLMGLNQESIKKEVLIDKNNNGVGEYSDNINYMLETKYLTKDINNSIDYSHYNYMVKVGESVEEREKSFEIYAIPKVPYNYCDKYGDGIVACAIDETGVMKFSVMENAVNWDPPIGIMKKWQPLSSDCWGEQLKKHFSISLTEKILNKIFHGHY
ncbi:MAG: hypothetical protein AB1599_00585 [Planctomycetota bacterium]